LSRGAWSSDRLCADVEGKKGKGGGFMRKEKKGREQTKANTTIEKKGVFHHSPPAKKSGRKGNLMLLLPRGKSHLSSERSISLGEGRGGGAEFKFADKIRKGELKSTNWGRGRSPACPKGEKRRGEEVSPSADGKGREKNPRC